MRRRRFNFPWAERAPEPGPITLDSRRLYILPTRTGLAYAALMFGLLLASINYGISLGYLFTFLLGGMGMVGLFHTQRNLLRLTLRPLAPAPVFAGETASFRLVLENPSRRLRAGFILASDEATSEPADLPPGDSIELVLHLPQPQRGLHRPCRLSLASTWPLGLFRCWTVFAFNWNVVVYPKPASTPIPFPADSGEGGASVPRRAGDEEFAGLREYRPGDPIRRMAWKSVARGLAPTVKQFNGTGGHELWLDWATCPEPDVEGRLSRLTRWALDAEREKRSWGLRLPGFKLPPGQGDNHLRQALDALARHGLA